MFLAHVSGWSHESLMEMTIDELRWWYNEALKLHNKLNKQ